MPIKQFKARSPGKCILFGEHFVVDGEPAVLTPLTDLYCQVTLTRSEHVTSHAEAPALGERSRVEALMTRALYIACDALRLDIKTQKFRIESTANFPISRGFGSSASFSVSLVKALDQYRNALAQVSADWSELFAASLQVEKLFHGTPSGADVAAALSSTPIVFENGSIRTNLSITAVDVVVVDSGDRDLGSTKIRDIIKFREERPNDWLQFKSRYRELLHVALECLPMMNRHHEVARALKSNHELLSQLGLSTSGIDELIALGIKLGALAGKVSGAGGGGAVVFVTERGSGLKLADAFKAMMIPVRGVL